MSSTGARSTVPARGTSDSGIAPAWHTAVVLFFMFGVSFISAHVGPSGIFGAHGRVPSYLLAILVEWIPVTFIWWGLSRRGIRLSDLVGGSWARPVYFLRDLGLAIAFFLIVAVAVLQGLTFLLKAVPPKAIYDIMPQTPFEKILWVLTSLTAGFCEEVIFRGYLQRQFSGLTRSLVGGIALQAIAFGLSHGYQA